MNVVIAVITARGASTMHTLENGIGRTARVIKIDEGPKSDASPTAVILKPPVTPVSTRASSEGALPTKQAKAAKMPNAAPRKPRVAPGKAKSGKKANQGKKAPKGAKSAKKKAGPREGNKTEKVLDLLKRPDGATLAELMKATNWQAHSVRGFLSGTVGKKLGLSVASNKEEGGDRTYSVKA
jgi:uncharacterized protein DUF3489